MKKILILIVISLMLFGCAGNDTIEVNRKAIVFFETVLDDVAEATQGQGKRYLGTGIVMSRFVDGFIEGSGREIYPLFEGDHLVMLIVFDHDNYFNIIDEDALSAVENNLGKSVSYVDRDPDIILVTGNSMNVIYGDNNCLKMFSRSEEEAMKKLQRIKMINPLGERKVRLYDHISDGHLVTDPDTGKQYSNSRLVVRFAEGNTESYIKEFSEYCQGKLKSQNGDLYVFEVAPASYTVLMNLIQMSKDTFKYVQDVFLDEANVPYIDPGKGSTSPV